MEVSSSGQPRRLGVSYFARLLGAAVYRCDAFPAPAKRKSNRSRFYGDDCHFVLSAGEIYAASGNAGPRAEWPLYGSVYLRRAGHRLARQQQYRRQYFPARWAMSRTRSRHGSS